MNNIYRKVLSARRKYSGVGSVVTMVGAALVGMAVGGAAVGAGALAQPDKPPVNRSFKILTPEGNHLFLVFSNPADGKEAEFNSFTDRHVGDAMKLPGFVSAQRFVLSPRGPKDPPFRYLTVYELKGKEPGPVIAQMGVAGREGRLEAPDKAIIPEVTSSVWTAVGQQGPQ
ncbi:MAG: hypothetical protein JF608_12160 [Sphingomonadales bacterium]|nr:hypothetical protein [Sphingomonadales bacterium]